MNPEKKDDQIERTARIFNVQKFNVHDGPGVRTLIFFKGCPLRCKWCSNPEGLIRDFQIMVKKQACISCGACVHVCPRNIHEIVDGQHRVNRDISCIACGKCEKACMQNALEVIGEDKPISELVDIALEDIDFYRMSGGGLTVGGGECTSQPDSLNSLLGECRSMGVNTAIETCGYLSRENLDKIKDNVDYFLFDMKHMDPVKHKKFTGVNNEIILSNLRYLIEQGKKVKVRMPLLNGVNDSEEEISAIANFLDPYKYYENFLGVDLLPYHRLGVGKYDQLDMEYPMEGEFSLSDERLDEIQKWIEEEGINVNLIKH